MLVIVILCNNIYVAEPAFTNIFQNSHWQQIAGIKFGIVKVGFKKEVNEYSATEREGSVPVLVSPIPQSSCADQNKRTY